MPLSYKKLIQFDLLNDVESSLGSDQKQLDQLFRFFQVVQEINNADQFIKDLPSFPYSTKNIVRGELISAIGSTLAIEGINLKEDEIDEVLQNPELKDRIQINKQEVLNSQKVYNYIVNEVNNHEGKVVFTEDHICTIHKFFTENIGYFANKPGVYRDTGATFGEPRKKSLCSNYADIYTAMKNFIVWLNEEGSGPWSSNIFVKSVMSHFYLTEIHPFGDGNGRVARAVEAMVLYANNTNNYCFWSLANFWSIHRGEYIAHLGNIRNTCNPINFIIWGAEGYLQEVKRIKTLVLKKVKQLMFRDYVNWLFATRKEKDTKERINKRILGVLTLLNSYDKILLDKLRSDPAYKAYYSKTSVSTQNRDFTRMKTLRLIHVTASDGKDYVEPNYNIFNELEYRV